MSDYVSISNYTSEPSMNVDFGKRVYISKIAKINNQYNYSVLTLGNYSNYDVVNNTILTSEPQTTQAGVITNLDSISRFKKVQIFINFKFLPIDDYRQLIGFLNPLEKENTQYTINYYDIDTDRMVSGSFYLAPEAQKTLYWKNGKIRGVVTFALEFIGTNTETIWGKI